MRRCGLGPFMGDGFVKFEFLSMRLFEPGDELGIETGLSPRQWMEVTSRSAAGVKRWQQAFPVGSPHRLLVSLQAQQPAPAEADVLDLIAMDPGEEGGRPGIVSCESHLLAFESVVEIGVLEGQRHHRHEAYRCIQEGDLAPEVARYGVVTEFPPNGLEPPHIEACVTLFLEDNPQEVSTEVGGRGVEQQQCSGIELYRLQLVIRQCMENASTLLEVCPSPQFGYLRHSGRDDAEAPFPGRPRRHVADGGRVGEIRFRTRQLGIQIRRDEDLQSEIGKVHLRSIPCSRSSRATRAVRGAKQHTRRRPGGGNDTDHSWSVEDSSSRATDERGQR